MQPVTASPQPSPLTSPAGAQGQGIGNKEDNAQNTLVRGKHYSIRADEPTSLEKRKIEDTRPRGWPASWPAPEWRDLPLPPEAVKTIDDSFIKNDLQDASSSIGWYRAEIEKRQKIEARGEEYGFQPLTTTLLNMKLLTEHILKGKQFALPLSEEARPILSHLLDEINSLLSISPPPYKRTVMLSLKLTLIYDLLVREHLLSTPERGYFGDHNLYEGSNKLMEGLSLHDIHQVPWMTLPENKDAIPPWIDNADYIKDLLSYLNRADILLYPSYEPLDLEDFANFGHLPVYPIGMITEYALGADGMNNLPYSFYEHDLTHISIHHSYVGLYSPDILAGLESRLIFRQAALQLPEEWPLTTQPDACKPVNMLLFEQYHETDLSEAIHNLTQKDWLYFYLELQKHNREYLYHFSQQYHGITDLNFALGSLWLYSLFHYWRDQGGKPLAAEEISAFARNRFLPKASALIKHFEFYEANKLELVNFFISHGIINEEENFLHAYEQNLLLSFESCPSRGIPKYDYYDVFYFLWIRASENKQRLESEFHVKLPDIDFA